MRAASPLPARLARQRPRSNRQAALRDGSRQPLPRNRRQPATPGYRHCAGGWKGRRRVATVCVFVDALGGCVGSCRAGAVRPKPASSHEIPNAQMNAISPV
jgi:hypothetical protein